MDCRKCERHLADFKDIFFFTKSKNEVHLAIKPETREILVDKVFVVVRESKKKVRVKCKKCLENVGTDQPFGPQGSHFLAFGTEKIILFGKKFSTKQKWSELMIRFPNVDRRNLDNFFGKTVEPQTEISDLQISSPKEPIRFAALLQDFEWLSLTPKKQARSYQVEAYIEALQQDLVVVIDTGLGKTLIASMVIARMKIMNPHRMTVMLVDRIPLVFQQGQAIANDTGLRVCRLCSENRTSRRIKQLHDGTFDVLVVTAGSFWEMTSRHMIEVSDFSVIVLDESHHATGEHIYTKILRSIDSCPRNSRPRLLGLTASPFKVENVVKGKNQLVKFRKGFLNAAFFYPNIPKPKNIAVEVTVHRTGEQDCFIADVIKIISQNVKRISDVIGGFSSENVIKESMLYQLKGQVKAVLNEYPESNKLQAIVKDIMLLFDIKELCELLGITHAVDVLKENSDLPLEIKLLIGKYSSYNEVVPRLARLEGLLERCSSETRAIVFVGTQISAHRLLDHLGTRFPDLNPRIVVGHGGYFGMNWDEEQKPVLREFRDGKTNLLVATSVLEEGLDVAECDLVIRYSGPNTLINFIQSRGRARKHESEFYVFVDEGQKKSAAFLENQEKLMRHLISVEGSKDCLPSVQSKEIKRILEQGNQQEAVAGTSTKFVEKGESEKVMVLEFYVRTSDEELSLRDSLIDDVEQYDIFKIHRICHVEKDAAIASGTSKVFGSADKVFLVSLICEDDDIERAFEVFSKHWDFELNYGKNISHVWCKHDLKTLPVSASDVKTTWQPIRVEFGRFTSKQTFECSKTICSELDQFAGNQFVNDVGNFEVENTSDCRIDLLEFKLKRSVTLRGLFQGSPFCIDIPLSQINNFTLLSIEKDNINLFIPLTSVPSNGDNTESPYLLEAISEDSVLCITFDSSSWQGLRKNLSLKEIMPVPVFISRVKREYAYEQEYELDRTVARLEQNTALHDCLWMLRVLRARFNICVSKRTMLFLCEELQRAYDEGITGVYEIALNHVLHDDLCYWADIIATFTTVYESLKKLPESSVKLATAPVPAHHVMIKRVIITPTKIVCLPATPVAYSRLLRYYGGQYEFVIVRFREEQFQTLRGDELMLRRIEEIIKNGFKIMKHYWFFSASASQLRDHKAYFVAVDSYSEVQELRASIVMNRHEQTSTAKYLSKIGLFCTSDKPTVSLPKPRTLLKNDKEAFNGDLVTDGCGKISKKLAEEVSSKLGLQEEVPAAFQVRVAGIKGVLVVAGNGDVELGQADVIYRDSMLKFQNEDEALCVVSYSKYHKLFLNREVITLLTSINQSQATGSNWMIEETIAALHEKALWDAADIFEDSLSACIALTEYVPKKVVKQVADSGFDVLCEPFWFSLLQSVYRLSVTDLRRKTRIPIQEGCLLMGVADPCGILTDDEIFLQIQEDPSEPAKVITGKVLIFRNPCLHPGDVRWVRAVNSPLLLPWKNVVILPTDNVCCSLAAECSGGDLDGDLFAIIWDQRFILPSEIRIDPLNYSELARGAPQDYDQQTEASLFAKMFVNIVSNFTLGVIATVHLAVSDILKNGACDGLAKELAKAQSQAVDFPKTGISPEVPEDALLIVNKNYPDFMERKDRESYFSEKVIGVLYRRCRSLVFDFELMMEKKRGYRFDLDLDLIVDGHELYLTDASKKFQSYRNSLTGIMVHYSLKREAEVVLGKPFSWDPLLKADKGSVMKAISGSYEALVKKYRDEFFQDVVTHEDIRKKASAWYRVSYDKKLSKIGSKNVYSFPWVVHDVLCGIKSEKRNAEIQRPNSVHTLIGKSVFKEFLFLGGRLESMIARKENILRCIKAEIGRVAGKDVFAVEAYGSFSMYLCDEDSDLDVCLTPLKKAWQGIEDKEKIMQLSPQAQARHFLEMFISRSVDNIASSKKINLNAPVPLITILVGDSNNEAKVDLSFNKIGLLKTRCMHRLYNDNKNIFPLFWILVRWARSVGVIRSGFNTNEGNDIATHKNEGQSIGGTHVDGLIASAEFYALIIHLLELKTNDEIPKEEKRSARKVCKLNKVLTDARKAAKKEKLQVAEMLITFFRRGASMESDIEMVWPNKEIPTVLLPAQSTKLVAVHCMNALHCILATRDVTAMLSHMRSSSEMEITLTKKLAKCLIHAIGKASHFHAARLASITGAKVQISSENIIFASGTRSAIMKLKEEIHDLSITNRALMLGRLPKKTSRYFMAGSSLVIMKKNSSADAMIEFKQSEGPWNMLHHISERHHPQLRSEQMHEWIENAVDRVSERLMQQLHKLPFKNAAVMDSLTVSIVYGCFYVVDISRCLPPSKPTIAVSDLEMRVEKGRRNRKSWERGEFVASPSNEKPWKGKKVTLGNVPKLVLPSPFAKANTRRKIEFLKNGITSSFCAGILGKNCHGLNQVTSCEVVYTSALQLCGFQPGTNGFIRENCGWKINSLPSSSYEVVIRVGEDARNQTIEERPLKWLSVNFIDGDKQTTSNGFVMNNDFRIKVITRDSVKESSDLYKSVLPTPNQPIIEVNEGKPSISSDYPQRSKSWITILRQTTSCKQYCKENFDASITTGMEYSGKDFAIKRQFCDLSLRYNPMRLDSLIRNGIASEDCREIANELCQTGIQLSEALKETVKKKEEL